MHTSSIATTTTTKSWPPFLPHKQATVRSRPHMILPMASLACPRRQTAQLHAVTKEVVHLESITMPQILELNANSR